MKVKSESEVTQSCPTLSDPMDCSPPGSMGFSRQEYWSGVPLPSPSEGLELLNILLSIKVFPSEYYAQHYTKWNANTEDKIWSLPFKIM